MLRIPLVRFQHYMIEKIGQEGWENILVSAGQPPDKKYSTVKYYPDTEFYGLIDAAVAKTGLPKDVLYRKLGKDCGQYLVKNYHAMFLKSWKTLDVIEKAAPKIYLITQVVEFHIQPKGFTTERISPNEVVIYYTSKRKLCIYFVGIIEAIAEYFNEQAVITQPCCMLNGDERCEIHVRLIKPS